MTDFDDNDIAIIGMAIRVPGASTPEEYWSNLSAGRESLRTYSDEELAARGVPAATLADAHYVKAGMPLQHVDQFDPEFFGFSPKEAAILDPQHRQFYEVAWEALERAGHPPKSFDGNIGVFAGCGMGAYFAFNLLSNPDLVESVGLFLLRHTGNDKDFLATRVSYAFDLKGPSVNVQTACSTSLVATHLAAQSLLARESDLALAGGVTIELPHGVGYHYKEGEILSPDGHCRTFDHRSKGTVFGSGVGAVVLRRLSDALAAGDHIHAVIKGSAVNNDGSTKVGYLAPSVDGQAAAIAEALAIAGVSADTVSYVECHGTATPVGDPIEIAALTQAFRESSTRVGYCRVGSVKTNIGHLDTAAGVASLIKASLALEHRQIPPSLHFEAPNPTIGFEGSPFIVASKLTDWRSETSPRRAGVNSLGVGGTNAFVVLQEAPPRPQPSNDESAQMLVLSARNKRALDDASARLAKWLRAHPEQALSEVSYTLLEGRHGFEHRRVLAAKTHEEAAALLENSDARRVFNHVLEVEQPSVVFMYPGGGAQYFQMGRGLYATEPVFREHIDNGLEKLKSQFKVDLAPVFFAEEQNREQVAVQLAKPSVQLPLIFLVEYALTRLWQHYGVEPAAIVGHSLGENTAACVAGIISFEDALGLVLLRGQLMDEVPEGAMLSVQLPARELLQHLGGELDLAAANSSQLSVASGPVLLIDQLAVRLTSQGIESQRVRINIAAHSRLLDGILERFRQYLRSIRLSEPTLPIISNRTGTWLDPKRARDPEYWVEHLRNTVLFADGITTLLESPDRVFIEVGPGNTLGSFARQGPQAPAQRVFASLRHHQDPVSDDIYFRAVIARLWAVGVKVDAGKLWQSTPRRVPLPTYSFQHASYWIEPGAGRAVGKEDIRPQRLAELDQWFRAPRWVQQGVLELDESPKTWLIFRGNEPVADAIVQRLRSAGHTVVTVQAGDTFSRLDEQTFTLAPEAGGSGYQELIEVLQAAERLPDRVLHTWLLTWDRSFRPGSSFFHRNQEYGFYSLLHLAQAFGKAGVLERKIHIIVAANGVHRIRAEVAAYPDKATALGPCAVIPREFANITCRFVDVEIDGGANAKSRKSSVQERASHAIEALETEASAVPATDVVAWRGGVRWQRHLGPWRGSETGSAANSRLRQAGVYLITGGLGGIAGVVAEWLAREYRAKLVLVARTPLPRREDWDEWIAQNGAGDAASRSIQRIRKLESLGAQVLAMDADVTVAERMREVVTQASKKFGSINGVFHTAGVIRDNLIQLKTQRDVEEVFSAKVYGTVVLDELFAQMPLDFMVLFSSTSSFIAPQGQIDYVGANAFLNAFAEAARGTRPYPIIAVNWGIWQGVGMVGAATAKTDDVSLQAILEHGSKIETRYPHFEQMLGSRDGLQHVHLLSGTFSAERDWMIDEHRLANGDALLPGTGYLELIRAALAEAAQLEHWQLSNLVFANPFFVRAGEPRSFRVRLRGDDTRWDVDVFARRLGAVDDESWELCATARVSKDVVPAAPISVDDIEARCTVSQANSGATTALRTRQEDHLRFGPRWSVLRRISFGRGEALARLRLADAYAAETSQYGLHPGLLDIATGCAMDLIPGYASQEVAQNLWAPISYRGLRFHRPLPAELVSWLRVTPDSSVATGFAAFDIVLCDTNGNVVAEVDQLTLRRIDGELRIPEIKQDLPSAAEVASIPEKQRAKPASPAEVALQHNVTQGIDAAAGVQALAAALSSKALPSTLIISSMDVGALIRQAESISSASSATTETRFTRPQLDSEFEAPRDDVEKALAEVWGKLLGVEGVGIRDSFFDLGGHSLIAVRLFNEIADRFKVDLPMSVLMQSPTVAALAEIVRSEAGIDVASAESADSGGESKTKQKLQYRFVVPMHAGPVADRTPIFMVAGMFGNVLNLSHMAHLLGEERPFYALQARGLYGDSQPHETFEEAAADYIAEVRKVQPNGPYLLGGFSGGGITAYEMARQLLAEGESVLRVIMLDTPIRENRHFSVVDRLSMFTQGFTSGGVTFLRHKIRERVEWERKQRELRRSNSTSEPVDPAQFQSKRIGDAFLRALERYRVNPAPLNVALFRPKLAVRYRLSGGRMVDSERNYIAEDNGWRRYVSELEIVEVPGNHDSMVLEPNVRVLVAHMRRSITRASN